MRSVALVTTARSDWGIQRTIAEALHHRPDVTLRIIAGGMHLSEAFGSTVQQIEADGFKVDYRLDFNESSDTPHAVATSMARGIAQFAALYDQWRPDVVTILGDRFDMIPAALAATPFLIPIAHIHGGEITFGAIDDDLRHAMTKLSHLHLVATEEYARRVRQLGEPADRVFMVGAPGLDDIHRFDPVSDSELHNRFGFSPDGKNLLVVYHPQTRAYQRAAEDVCQVLAAIEQASGACVIIGPNADTGHRAIIEALAEFERRCARACVSISLDRRTFLSLMRRATVIIGNSSAALLEAPSFKLPAVNIGDRQAGRVRAANVIDVPCETSTIVAAIEKATSPGFRTSLADLVNPYGDGRSGVRIAEILATVRPSAELVCKRFVDWPEIPRRSG